MSYLDNQRRTTFELNGLTLNLDICPPMLELGKLKSLGTSTPGPQKPYVWYHATFSLPHSVHNTCMYNVYYTSSRQCVFRLSPCGTGPLMYSLETSGTLPALTFGRQAASLLRWLLVIPYCQVSACHNHIVCQISLYYSFIFYKQTKENYLKHFWGQNIDIISYSFND